MTAPEPAEVEVVRDGSLHVHWTDGHESTYELHYLRGYCPCAHCQGHGVGQHFVPNDAPRITAIEEVGNYALGIQFAGGHNTGIFTFELLRRLCPCDACQRAQGDHHPIVYVQRT